MYMAALVLYCKWFWNDAVFIVRMSFADSLRLYEMFMGPLHDTKVGGISAPPGSLHLFSAPFCACLVTCSGTRGLAVFVVRMSLVQTACAHKMSKSRGNVINPDDVVQDFGGDSLRLYEMFMGPLRDTKVGGIDILWWILVAKDEMLLRLHKMLRVA
jgi:hypothetical protein